MDDHINLATLRNELFPLIMKNDGSSAEDFEFGELIIKKRGLDGISF